MTQTKEAIQSAFIKLYSCKSYEKMNIKQICVEAPVARTTFYEYYENIAELKEDIENTLINGILELDVKNRRDKVEESDLAEYFSRVFSYIKENWDVNYAFLVKQPNYEYIEKWKSAIKNHFKWRFPEKSHIPNYNVITEVLASGIIGAYVYWMKHPDEVDALKINEISVKVLKALMDII